jgi:hypothetical protein
MLDRTVQDETLGRVLPAHGTAAAARRECGRNQRVWVRLCVLKIRFTLERLMP